MEEGAPLLAQRRELLASGGGEAVVAAVAAGVIALPATFDGAAFLHFIEQGIKRGEGEGEGSVGALADLSGDFEAIEGLVGEQREDGEFGAAAGDLGTDAFGHGVSDCSIGILWLEYRDPI